MVSDAQRGERLWLLAIVGLAVLLRLAVIAAYPHLPESDEVAYRAMAANLVAGNGIVDSAGNRAMYNVGYPLLVLAPLFAVFGAEALLPAKVAHALLGGLSVWLCHRLAGEVGGGRTARLLAALALALYLPAALYCVYLYKENLLTPVMLGALWAGIRMSRAPSAGLAALCGLLFGAIALIGNAGLCLAAPVALGFAMAPAGWPRKAMFAVVAAVVAGIVVAPWMARNAAVLGAPVLNTNGGFNLYLGNNPSATGMFMSIADTPRGADWTELRRTGELQSSNELRREALAWIADNPARFATLALNKAVYFWTPPFHRGAGPSSRLEDTVRVLWAVQFVLLFAALASSVLLPALRTAPVSMVWLAIGCYTAVHMLFYVIYRYREPIMPLLCVVFGLVGQVVLERLRATRQGVRADRAAR